jgi:hypothetical protein
MTKKYSKFPFLKDTNCQENLFKKLISVSQILRKNEDLNYL